MFRQGDHLQVQTTHDVWGSEGIASAFATSALDGGEWSVSHSGLFTPGEGSPGSHWIAG
jgi:hypothetical protein